MKAESTGSFAKLKEDLAQAQQQQALFQTVAQDGANRLIEIEKLLFPQMGRKPKFWNFVFHFGEIISALQAVIKIIKEFREKFMTPAPAPEPANDATN